MLEKHFSPAAIEAKHRARWEQSNYNHADLAGIGKPYTIMMPPPNVTGSLHLGHALSYTLQDVLARYHRAQGRDVLWQPGTDHAGIVTQLVVERQLAAEGTMRAALGRDAFIERVWRWQDESGGAISDQLRRLGAMPDWDRMRFTMDKGMSRAVTTAFVQLYRGGLIYRDYRLVNWDPVLQTAISDLEVDKREIAGHLWHIRYPLADDATQFITVATTRPETMLGDVAVAVHSSDERYQHLIGRLVQLPITGRLIPIIADEYSDPEKGTGAVKITPAHDFNDYEVARRHGLPAIIIFDKQARIVSQPFETHSVSHPDSKWHDKIVDLTHRSPPEELRGLDRFAARKKILEMLEGQGFLDSENTQKISHAVPYGDRSDAVIEPYLTQQWFCDAKTLAGPAIKAVEEGHIKFFPEQWKNTYFAWLKNIEPWCISRQIWWGHQIPAWIGPTGEIIVAENENEARAEAVEKELDFNQFERDPDVLDTWFSSGLFPFATLGWPDKTPELQRYYPSDTLVTGFDIIFFWVARMIMFGLYFKPNAPNGASDAVDFARDVPFREIYIHPLIRDARGQKMSKSKGNVIDPLSLINKYGADALRFTLTILSVPGRDLKISPERVEIYRNFATKLWNAARFAELNECKYDPEFDPSKIRHPINRWILHKLVDLFADIKHSLKNYRYDEFATNLYRFIWNDFCDWYLELSKPLLEPDSEFIQETQIVLGFVLRYILIYLHPIMPFITEELWENFGFKPNLAAEAKCGQNLLDVTDNDSDFAQITAMIQLIEEVRSARSALNVPANSILPLFLQFSEQQAAGSKSYILYQNQIERLGRVTFVDNRPANSFELNVPKPMVFIGLGGAVDVPAEKARLGRERDKFQAEYIKYDAKLSNPGFRDKADPDIIIETKEKRDEARHTAERLSRALASLDAMSNA